jgi:Flp pilus assembly protein TadG
MKTMTLRMSHASRRFARDRRGVSAVEFALLAPIMVALYLGCVEVSDAVSADRKVSLTAAAVANLTAQVATISTSDMTNILDASTAIISPYSASKLKITVSCLNIDANKNVTVKWSATRNGGGGRDRDRSVGAAGGQLAVDL